MKKVALSKIKEDLSGFLQKASKEEVIITRRGHPIGILIGFASEGDWLDYRLTNDPAFQKRIESARKAIREGRGTRLEEVRARLEKDTPSE